jgi:hypothetical protein
MKYFFAVDVETTGQFLTKNAMIAIGCSIMNEKGEELDKFLGFLKIPENRTWEERCVNEFWSKEQETLDFIKKQWEDPKIVMNEFATWLDRMDLKYGEDLVFLSNNVGYDCAWVDQYLSEFTTRRNIYYRLVSYAGFDKEGNGTPRKYSFRRVWCTNSMFHGVLLERTGIFEEWNLEKKSECENEVWKNDHNPLNDARTIISNYLLFYNKSIKKE